MLTITQETFYEEIAKAIFKDLKNKLLKKQRNHCMRVDYLPQPVMKYACQKINSDSELQSKEVEAYILSNKAINEYEIESGRLIELRNRLDFGVLIVFIPQGFTGAAEDSYDIHTFEAYDFANVFTRHKKELISSFNEEEQKILKQIFESSAVNKQSIENQIRYLLALKQDGCTYETAGAYLHYLNLIPDLKLNKEELESRLLLNRESVEQLSNPTQTIFLAIENLVNKGLDPNYNQIKKSLIEFFLNTNTLEVSKWTATILHDENWLKKLSFDKWKFRDLSRENIEIIIEPFVDDKGKPKTYTKLQLENNNLVATTNSRITLKWQTSPRKSSLVSRFSIILEKEVTGEERNELLSKTAKSTSERITFPLKEAELEEGEEWLVHFRIVAYDHNNTPIAEDTSDPFYLRGEEADTIGSESKQLNKIRNIAEAVLNATYKYRKKTVIVNKSWETGKAILYRIKTSPRSTYQIALNEILYNLELKTLQDPYNCGVWDVNIVNRSFIENNDFKAGKIKLDVFKDEFKDFLGKRRDLFHAITSDDSTAVIEILDLREYKELILAYANAYLELIKKINDAIHSSSDAEASNILENSHLINRLDTAYIRMGTEDTQEELLLLMPTHPFKILWLLQYQTLLYNWSDKMIGMSEKEVKKAINIENINKILPLNLPNALSFEKGVFFINTDTLDLYWSIFPKSTTEDIRKVVGMLSKALGYKDDLGNISSVTPKQIADRLLRYLRHHPYIQTLKINIIHPGNGLLFLNTIRELQKEYKNLRYDITFYGSQGYELMGNAFDELVNENDLSENRTEIDEELLAPSHNPLFPKLFFSKIKVEPNKWEEIEFKEANITIIIDHFNIRTITRPKGDQQGSYFLHGLLAEYRSEFNVIEQAVTWSRKVIPSQTSKIDEDDEVSDLIFLTGENILGLSSATFDWGKSTENLPTIQLELSQQDKYILSKIHEMSDWVFTIDRNFGIEYFDNPSDTKPCLKSYLIDYTPEFMDGIGHRLIVSTGWISEIEKLIEDGLRKINIPTSSYRAVKILDIIKSISGKLALKLINNPNSVREIIGLAITRLVLEKKGLLKDAVLIPVDTHIDIFTENKKRSVEDEVTVKRSDLILVSLEDNKLNVNLIEVKFRSGEGDLFENYSLKEEIYKKNENSEEAFRTKYISSEENPKIDLQLANKELSTLIGFYLERAKRNGFCTEASELNNYLDKISAGEYEIKFEKTGYIIHWNKKNSQVSEYKGNKIYEIGHNDIVELLEIRETEIEEENEGEETSNKIVNDKKSSETQIIDNETNSNEKKDKKETKRKLAVQDDKTTFGENHQNNLYPNILLGKNAENDDEVWFNPNRTEPKKLTNQHILIVGKSGAGKSQTTSAILYELSKQSIPFLIIDFQGEYTSTNLTNSKGETFENATNSKEFNPLFGMDINPLELSLTPKGEKLPFMTNVYQISDILKQIFKLGDIQHSILRDAIKQAYYEKDFSMKDKNTWNNEPPAFQDIWRIIEAREKNEGSSIRTLKYRVEPLFENNIFVPNDNSFSIEKVLSQNSIINLSTLPTLEIMKAVARFILQSVYNRMLAEGPSNSIKLYVVIDEAHKLSYNETLTDSIREARKYGVGFILASQSPGDFAPIIFENMGTKIALQLEGDDAKYLGENFGVSDKEIKKMVIELLIKQEPLRALIKNNHYDPFVQVDITPFYKK